MKRRIERLWREILRGCGEEDREVVKKRTERL